MKTFLFAGVAVAAFMTQAQAADIIAPASYDWSGFFVGANFGGAASDANVFLPALAGADGSPSWTSLTAGGEMGYRVQLGHSIVVGISAGANWQDATVGEDQLTGYPGVYWDVHSSWNGNVQASLGLALDRALIYGMGGVALTDLSGCTTVGSHGACVNTTQFSGGRTGWTVGAGLTYALTDNFSANVEYHYADYGSQDYITLGSAGGTTTAELHTHTYTVGLQYKF